ncbi:glycosyltransferase [Pseudodesulfovibrio cashew]|uniref:Glycosyltransferase n=1 Tax=Pseudodesulfovibrio cashew TaxID=2678688 RepID=A0A6I6JC76_9BACT|nr:glycosyltransferase [Pseudodesulfovibrio cashew]QGY38729.1 glycosyltransferase [Pseudodesulfovibrio cashew]
MDRFDFPHTLAPCPGILPVFEERFNGWQLGMGLPGTLTAVRRGLLTLAKATPECRNVATSAALWAFQAHPLAPDTAFGVMETGAAKSSVPSLHRIAAKLAKLDRPDPVHKEDARAMTSLHDLLRQENPALILLQLKQLLEDGTKILAWLDYCWQDLLFYGKPAIPRAALDTIPWETTLPELGPRMEADWAFHCLPPEDALPYVERLDPNLWGLWRAYAAGELLLRMGRTGQAKGVFANLWKAIPWHVNLTLKLHSLFQPVSLADETHAEDAAVLLYSWNKADLLERTLDSLAQSRIGGARIYALDNGSTDRTPEVLDQALERFGGERLHVETLPVNVGAPAARNWLLALPGVRESKWAAFLDDDVILPEDWLLHLLGAAATREDAGAVGCRITAAAPPYGLQSADYNLIPGPPPATEPGHLPNRVPVFDNCAGTTDDGMFTYTRTCLSVSGCCHLVNLRAVEKVGGFDLRYTPSQFDDLDRDLRSALAGMPALYAGGLAVRHIQHSSLAKSQTTKQIGHVMGNKFKLDTKYSDEELIRLGEQNKRLLWQDLREKHGFLVDRLGLGA